MSIRERAHARIGFARFGGSCLLVWLGTACGAGPVEDLGADEEAAIDSTQAALTLPGAWYAVAPRYAWCLYRAATVSAACSAPYTFNSAGGFNGVTRIAAGRYVATLAAMPAGGNVQVVAVGNDNIRCHFITAVPGGGGVQIDVRCRKPSGMEADSAFELSYYREFNVGGPLGGYATIRGFVPPLSAVDAWNSSGGGVSATWTAVGKYAVHFPNQWSPEDTVLVTAASQISSHCKVRNWFNAAGGVQVNVDCYDFAGNPRNNEFSISYNKNLRGDPRNNLAFGTQGGFSWANQPAVAAYVPALAYQSNSRSPVCPMDNTAFRSGVGVYQSVMPHMGASAVTQPSAALATAYGNGAAYCKLQPIWSTPPAPTNSSIRILCFTGSGLALTDSMYTTMLMLRDAPGC